MLDPWKNPAIWHAINVHLPIVLAILGLPLVCILAITRGRHRGLRWGVMFFYMLVTAAAWFTVQTGERAMDMLPPTISQAASDRIALHEKFAVEIPLLAGITTALLLVANFPRRRVRQVFTTLALVSSVVTACWVAIAAHSGGLAVYDFGLGTVAIEHQLPSPRKSNNATIRYRSFPRKPESRDQVAASSLVPTQSSVLSPQSSSALHISFKDQIKPLLQSKCAECHAEDDIKGGFDIATLASITKGGKKAGPGIVPGKPDDSSIIKYAIGTLKPRMPKGEDPLADGEIALLKNWIAAGAIDDSNVKVTAAPNISAANSVATPAVATTAPATAPAPSVATTTDEKPSPDWDPQSEFSAAENVAVRRYIRLKNLPPPPAIPTTQATVFNPIDNFIIAKFPSSPATRPATTHPAHGIVTVEAQSSLQSSAVASAAPAVPLPAATPATIPPVAPSTTQSTTQASAAVTTAPTTAVAAPAATQPSDLADDVTFARRVYLDLIGMIPTAEEAKSFLANPDKNKRIQLVDALLARSADYAGNWVPFWEEALCSNGLHQGGVGTHGNYRQWIFDSFNANKPYDTFVQELLDPTMPGHPQRYVLNADHMRTVQSSADTAQVFLGTAIKCASCHSHFLNSEWPQPRAVAFAGYFTDKDMELIRCERKSGQFIATHFMFNLPNAPTTAPADQNQRLHQVAQLITDPTNPRFAKTMVNRLWKRYMGMGLFEPVDDYREDTPPSHPELLNWLADDFMRHGFDVKRTARLILTSRTYQLRYDPALEDHFDVSKPKDPRYFRSPALRRLTEEQLLDSINVMMTQRVPESRAFQSDVSSPLTRALGKPPVRNEVSTARPDDTAIVQALEFLNGGEWHDRAYKGELITNSSVDPDLDKIVSTIYWSAFSRPPIDKEKDTAVAFLKTAPPPATTQPVEVVYMDDDLPAHAVPEGLWSFGSKLDQPVYSGTKSHTEAEPSPIINAPAQHLFTGVSFPIAPTDVLYTYAYIDAKRPPKEIMIQFMYKGAWHRASWGGSDIPFAPNHPMGDLPKAGEWVRLDIPADKIGITKPGKITGIAFTNFNGKVYWDKTGAMKGAPIHDPQSIGDMIWALISSPEFQYIR